jgi:hypothetical protein
MTSFAIAPVAAYKAISVGRLEPLMTLILLDNHLQQYKLMVSLFLEC